MPLLPGSLGKIVHVAGRVEEVNYSAVSASVDSDPWFSRDAEPDRPKWHAVRIHARCRPMGSAEACCERVGSLVKLLWSERQGRTSHNALMGNVLLTEAKVQCVGGDRDEALCQNVTDILMRRGLQPLVQSKKAVKRRREERGRARVPKRI